LEELEKQWYIKVVERAGIPSPNCLLIANRAGKKPGEVIAPVGLTGRVQGLECVDYVAGDNGRLEGLFKAFDRFLFRAALFAFNEQGHDEDSVLA